MRAQLAVFVVLAGAVAGCASTPPPPPPMAAMEPAPAPAPAPLPMGPVDGMYRGPVAKTAESAARCRNLPATASTRVRNNAFTLAGMRGRVGPDGTVSATGRRGTTMTGTLAGGTLDVTSMAGGCGYRYTLARG